MRSFNGFNMCGKGVNWGLERVFSNGMCDFCDRKL